MDEIHSPTLKIIILKMLAFKMKQQVEPHLYNCPCSLHSQDRNLCVFE